MNSQRFSLVSPAEIDIDLGLFTGSDSGGGVVVLGLASVFSSLENGDGTVAMSSLINDSVEVVEIRGIGVEFKVVNSTIIRGTIDVKESKNTTVGSNIVFGVKDHGTIVIFLLLKTTTGINDFTSIDMFKSDVNTSESKGGEPEQADKQ